MGMLYVYELKLDIYFTQEMPTMFAMLCYYWLHYNKVAVPSFSDLTLDVWGPN